MIINTHPGLLKSITISLIVFLLILSNFANADARLEKKLDLNMDQARQVQLIQKDYRKQFSSKRQEFNRESRKLRRARSDNDSNMIAQQELITGELKQQLKQIRLNENEEIRKHLTPEQRQQFEEIIQQRNASVGSSRDAKLF